MNKNAGLPPNGGEIARLMQSHDWSHSPLGLPEAWPQSLRSVVGLMLSSKFPMFLAWGPHLISLYNDAYIPVMGAKHPHGFGRPFAEVWSEIWPDISPMVDRALSGEAVYQEDLPLILRRHGFEEPAFFTFSYSPVWDENGSVAGMYCVCSETTEKVITQRQQVAEHERLRDMFRQAPGFMAVLRGPDHIYEFANDAYFDLIGRRDIAGVAVREALPEVEGQGLFELLDHVHATGEVFVGRELPVKLARRPGQGLDERHVSFVFQPLRDGEGRVTGIFLQGNDVTEAKQTQTALNESRERFRLLAQTIEQISAAQSRDDVLSIVFSSARALCGADGVCLITRDGDQSHYVAEDSAAPLWSGQRFPLISCVSGRAMTQNRTIIIPDIEHDESVPLELYRTTFVKSLVMVPIAGGEGAVAVGAYWGDVRTPHVEEVEVLEALSRSAGSVLQKLDAQAAFRESDRRLKATHDNASVGICEVDRHARYISVNETFKRMTGSCFEELEGRSFLDFIEDEDDRQSTREIFEGLVRGDIHSYCKQRLYTKADGEKWWGEVNISPVRDENGEFLYAVRLLQDITASKKAEEALRESEEKYRTLFEAMDDGYLLAEVIFDEEGRAVDIEYLEENQAAVRITGRRMAGRRLREIDPGFEAYWFGICGEVARTGIGQRMEQYAEPLGLWFDFYVFRVGGDDSRRVAVVFQDVTERRLAEERLRDYNDTLENRVADALAERNVLAHIVESTDAFIKAVDLNYRILGVNEADAAETERVLGVRPRVGDNLLDILSGNPNQQERLRALWDRVLSGEEFTVVERFEDREGGPLYYDIKFNVLRDRDGTQIGAYHIKYDVSEQLRDQARLNAAEEQLRQAQKMEAVGLLTGGVAHDFNNLLQALSGCLTMIGRRTQEPKVQPLLEAGQLAVDRGAKLVQQLMGFARRESLRPEAIDVRERVIGMRELLARALRADIQLKTAMDDVLWPVEADVTQFELALINMAVNSRDAMPQGGEFVIEARNVVLPADHPSGLSGEHVQLSVADTGCGMPPHVIARAFEPFFTTKGIGKGSGLGLSQVYGLARQAGGTASIESSAGGGTKITLFLKRTTAEVVCAAPRVDTEPVAPQNRSLLLVEDDQVVAASVAAALEDEGYAVSHVSTADEAFALLQAGSRFDIVFTDVVMPGRLNGIQLAHEIREHWPDVPVMLTTGYSHDIGAHDLHVLRKPYAVPDLVRVLHQTMTQRENEVRDMAGPVA